MTRSDPSRIHCPAPAKINLALHVTGKRADGYHLLESLAVFTDLGDEIELQAGGNEFSLTLAGLFAEQLDQASDNLVLRAARLLRDALGHDHPFTAIRLNKNLPVSSGIGGGSADAAATLCALAGCYGVNDAQLLFRLGAQLGADVPMCLLSRALLASGIGEVLTPLDDFPALHLLLVNPRVAVSTPQIFNLLQSKTNAPLEALPQKPDFASLTAWLSRQRNDLEVPATALQPVIGEVLSALGESGAQIARMSGSGATCFGLYKDQQSAIEASLAIAKHHPDWWIKETHTRDFGMDRVNRPEPEQPHHVAH